MFGIVEDSLVRGNDAIEYRRGARGWSRVSSLIPKSASPGSGSLSSRRPSQKCLLLAFWVSVSHLGFRNAHDGGLLRPRLLTRTSGSLVTQHSCTSWQALGRFWRPVSTGLCGLRQEESVAQFLPGAGRHSPPRNNDHGESGQTTMAEGLDHEGRPKPRRSWAPNPQLQANGPWSRIASPFAQAP